MNERLKKYLIFALKLLVSGTLLYFVLSRAGVGNVVELLKNIPPASFIAAVVLYLMALFLCTVRWKLLLPEKFGLRKLFPLYLIGSFFNTFMPGLVGGDAVKIYYLYKKTGKGAQALSSVFMDRYIGFTALMTLGLVAYPFGFKYFKGLWIEWLLPLVILIFVLVSLTVFGLRLGQRISVIGKLHDYFHAYRKKRVIMAKALALSFTLQLLVMLAIYILALGLDITIPFTALLVFIPIITTIATMPVSLSGIGLREAAAVLLLGTMDVSPESATALSFAWFLMAATGGLTGLYEYLKVKGSEPK
jgi:uncharacterized protein (TIRG00374 family)